MPYPFLGNAARCYPQYRDDGTDAPLQAEPGGVYSMTPVQPVPPLPVPPADGLWGPQIADEPDEGTKDEAAPEAAEPPSTEQVPPPATTTKGSKAAGAADEGA